MKSSTVQKIINFYSVSEKIAFRKKIASCCLRNYVGTVDRIKVRSGADPELTFGGGTTFFFLSGFRALDWQMLLKNNSS